MCMIHARCPGCTAEIFYDRNATRIICDNCGSVFSPSEINLLETEDLLETDDSLECDNAG